MVTERDSFSKPYRWWWRWGGGDDDGDDYDNDYDDDYFLIEKRNSTIVIEAR